MKDVDISVVNEDLFLVRAKFFEDFYEPGYAVFVKHFGEASGTLGTSKHVIITIFSSPMKIVQAKGHSPD